MQSERNGQIVLPHLAGRIFGTPLLIVQQKLDSILSLMMPRLLSAEISLGAAQETDRERGMAVTENGIAVIPILGITVRRASFLDAMCGLVSYQSLKETIESALKNPMVRGILLECDTPGGEAGGVFDLAEHIRALRQSGDKPIWAIADELAASAGYAIASAADRVLVTRTGQVGSIGVVATHIDQSAADKQEGLSYSFIYAGAHKIDGNAHMPLPPGVRADLQTDIDKIYDAFVSLVASHRGMKPAAVIDTQAAIFRGQEAVAVKLADAVQTFDEAISELSEFISRPAMAGARRGAATQSTHPKGEKMEGQEPAANPSAVTDQAVPDQTQALAAHAAEQERVRSAEIMAIAEQAKRLGVDIDAIAAIKDGTPTAALREEVLRKAAEKSAAANIVSASSAGANPQASQPPVNWDKAFAKASSQR